VVHAAEFFGPLLINLASALLDSEFVITHDEENWRGGLCSGYLVYLRQHWATHGAYVNGNNRPLCDTGSGATSCLVGRFVEIIGSGTVGPGVGGGVAGNKAIGVQLIR
jgi:hypothetical protein